MTRNGQTLLLVVKNVRKVGVWSEILVIYSVMKANGMELQDRWTRCVRTGYLTSLITITMRSVVKKVWTMRRGTLLRLWGEAEIRGHQTELGSATRMLLSLQMHEWSSLCPFPHNKKNCFWDGIAGKGAENGLHRSGVVAQFLVTPAATDYALDKCETRLLTKAHQRGRYSGCAELRTTILSKSCRKSRFGEKGKKHISAVWTHHSSWFLGRVSQDWQDSGCLSRCQTENFSCRRWE